MRADYIINENGVLSQVDPTPITYDFNYIMDGYGTIGEKRKQMSYLRYAYMCGAIGKPHKILEIGYGTGDFLSVCHAEGIECCGFDITGIPTPYGVESVSDVNEFVDVVCMFDVLEHFKDINMIAELNAKYVYVSLPNCQYPTDQLYLEKVYPHLKPNEHLHHFNYNSLKRHFESHGYTIVTWGYPEDAIRKRPNYEKNILTAIFKKL